MARCPNCGRETLRTEDWACQWCGYPLLSRGYKKIDKTYRELQEERRDSWGFPETELEPEPERQPEPRPKRKPEPEPELEAELEPEPEPEAEPELEVELETELEPEPEPEVEPEPQPTPALEAKLEAASGEIELSVEELNSVYQANRLAANARLTDKILTVTGVVDKVFVRDHLDIRYVVLTNLKKKAQWNVRCTFGAESISELSRLSEGQTVRVQGKYDGYGKNIILKDCVLVG
jgi:ribosomal protein L37E